MAIFDFLLTKLIKYVLDNYKIDFYFVILGFSLSSILVLLKMIISTYLIHEYIIGIILFITGMYFGYKLNK